VSLLEDLIIIINNNNNNNNTTVLLKMKFTLAKALSQSDNDNDSDSERRHHRRAVQLLHDIIEQSSAKTTTRDQSKTVGAFATRESKRITARAHFLLAELLKKKKKQKKNNHNRRRTSSSVDDNGDDMVVDDQQEEEHQVQVHQGNKDRYDLTIQYHYDQAVLLDGKQNLSLLLQCAKSSISLDSKFQHYKQILQINKYHIDANLWFAHYYQQYLMENDGVDDNGDQRRQNRQQRTDNANTTLLYISYMACIIRAQFTIQKYTTRTRQSAQTQSSNEYYLLKQQQCQQHRRYIQKKQSSSTTTGNEFVNSSTALSNINIMNHVSAAYIDVIQV
jgi:hypothetical protein